MDEKELEDINQQMKAKLQDWLANVSKLRKKLYALNYFTCLQLQKISCEFYQLIDNPEYQINKEVFLLLMSISPDLTIEHVKEVMSSAEAQAISLKSFNAPLPSAQGDSFHVVGEVHIEVEKLSEEEKEIYDTLITEYEYDPRLVLTALHHNGCDEEKIEIDASNSTVKELIDMDFSEALAIEAVKKFGEDLDDCLDYCSTEYLAKSCSEPYDGAPNEDLLVKADTEFSDNTESSISRYANKMISFTLHIVTDLILLRIYLQ